MALSENLFQEIQIRINVNIIKYRKLNLAFLTLRNLVWERTQRKQLLLT